MKFDFLKNIRFSQVGFIAFVIVLLLLLRQCSISDGLKDEMQIASQNQKALTDSVRVTKNKLGEEVFMKNTLIAEGSDLKKLNEKLYKEVKNLKGEVITIQQVGMGIKNDPIVMTNTITKYANGEVDLNWNYDTTFSEGNYRKLAGSTKIKVDSLHLLDRGTHITNDEMGISITTGLIDKDDSYQIFVKSNYPGFKVTDIQGSIIDKKLIKSDESTWVFGPYFGVGVGVDPWNKTVGPNVSVGLGITYNVNKKIKRIFKR